jgi:WD40 repeat protein
VLKVAFAPGTKLLATDVRNHVSVWDSAQIKRDIDRDKPAPSDPQHLVWISFGGDIAQSVTGLAFASDGKTLAVSGRTGQVVIWDVVANRKLQEWKFGGPIHCIDFAGDGRHVAVGTDSNDVLILRRIP